MIATSASITIVDAIVKLHGLIPVVATGTVIKTVIARSPGRTLHVWLIDGSILLRISLELRFRLAHIIQVQVAPSIIEVIFSREVHILVVILSKISHTSRLTDRVIFTSHMIRHEIHDDLHACLVGTLDETLPLRHTHTHVFCQVGIDVIVVGDGVRRTSLALHHLSMLSWNAIGRVVCLRSMTNDTGVPNMREAHIMNTSQDGVIKMIQFSTTVFLYRSVLLSVCILISKEAWKNLIY